MQKPPSTKRLEVDRRYKLGIAHLIWVRNMREAGASVSWCAKQLKVSASALRRAGKRLKEHAL